MRDLPAQAQKGMWPALSYLGVLDLHRVRDIRKGHGQHGLHILCLNVGFGIDRRH